MLGEGMPWHILLPFLLLGILIGANQLRPAKEETETTYSNRYEEPADGATTRK